jgi:hypothetical protein
MAEAETIGARAKALQERLKVAREESATWKRLSDAQRVEWLVRLLRSVQGLSTKVAKKEISAEFVLGSMSERLNNALEVVSAFEEAEKLESDIKKLTPTTVDSR